MRHFMLKIDLFATFAGTRIWYFCFFVLSLHPKSIKHQYYGKNKYSNGETGSEDEPSDEGWYIPDLHCGLFRRKD